MRLSKRIKNMAMPIKMQSKTPTTTGYFKPERITSSISDAFAEIATRTVSKMVAINDLFIFFFFNFYNFQTSPKTYNPGKQ